MEYYLGNGSKKPKLADYNKKFGVMGSLYYTADNLKYIQKINDKKQFKENDKKAREKISTFTRW